MKISDKTYNVLKWVSITFIPILITALSECLTILEIPVEKINLITEIVAAIGAAIGGVIGVSTITYNKEQTKTEKKEELKIYDCQLTENDIYKRQTFMKPLGIVVHSSGCNNNWLGRYVQPSKDDPNREEILKLVGVNGNKNSWNRSGVDKLMHFMIGYNDAEDEVCIVNTAPCDICVGGVASGPNGSYNTDHIQFEIQEDNLKDEGYFKEAFQKAIELCAYLCKKYDLPVSSICSHEEAYLRGYGNGHNDPQNWLGLYDKNMDWFRGEVSKLLYSNS